jgi:hypothetical protein
LRVGERKKKRILPSKPVAVEKIRSASARSGSSLELTVCMRVDLDDIFFLSVYITFIIAFGRTYIKNNRLAEMCSGSEEGAYSGLMDLCITQL